MVDKVTGSAFVSARMGLPGGDSSSSAMACRREKGSKIMLVVVGVRNRVRNCDQVVAVALASFVVASVGVRRVILRFSV